MSNNTQTQPAEHAAERGLDPDSVIGCSCGWRPDWSPADWRGSNDQWRAHAAPTTPEAA